MTSTAAAAAQVTLAVGKDCSHAPMTGTQTTSGKIDRPTDRNVLVPAYC